MNTQLEALRRKLTNIIAEEQLPIGVVYLAVKDLANELGTLYDQALTQEYQKAKAEKAKEEQVTTEEV